jgi:sigma-E factor negative regulatory protein RseC
MRETGAVLSVSGELVTITQEKFTGSGGSEACFGCMNKECKAAQGRVTASNPLGLGLKPGQRVEIETPVSSTVLQAVSALLPPVLGFITGYFLIALAFPASEDPARAAAGACLMLLAALGLYLYRRKTPVKNLSTVIKITGEC